MFNKVLKTDGVDVTNSVLLFNDLGNVTFLLCKIALPYPHKCLVGFVEQNTSADKKFLTKYSCHER